MIQLEKFSDLASLGHKIAVRDNDQGVPVLQAAPQSFKGRILSALSHVPFLKNLHAVEEYRQQVKTDNAQALGLFLFALSQKFGGRATEIALAKNNVDLSGGTPLQGRIVAQIINDARSSQICGFRNLGNTCYANSTLKLLLCSLGPDRLIGHLEKFSKTTADAGKRDAAEKFIHVVKASFDTDKPLEKELRALFSSLQKLDMFSNKDENGRFSFNIVGTQNDAQEFLAKLTEAFNLSEIEGCAMECKESVVNGKLHRSLHSEPAYCHDITATNPKATLQDIVDETHRSEKMELKWGPSDPKETEVTKVKQWTVPDVSTLHRFNLHLNTLEYDLETFQLRKATLEKANFTDEVTLNVLDEQTGQQWMVTFEPKEIVIQQGSANAGHYYMYSKQDDGDWVRHDDSTVHVCTGPGPKEQAKLIGFAVKQKVLLEPDEGSGPGT
ncbi:type III secretion system effector BopA family protein [Castellaniella ginsengisoli]|uniref:Effector protein BopA n=1 Tax=Castellaniella ginsengisoli TaxID=546114 RepID=A0AB39CKN8_9BURK